MFLKPTLLAATLALTPLAAQAGMNPAAHDAVLRALDDEYLAQTVYAQVIARTGAEKPFANIMRAEGVHQGLLADILRANNLPIPPNPYTNGAKPIPAIPAARAEACAVGVAAEIENIRLYDEDLLPAVKGDAQITAVMTKLRNDSAERHLRAFQRCAGGQAGMGGGRMNG